MKTTSLVLGLMLLIGPLSRASEGNIPPKAVITPSGTISSFGRINAHRQQQGVGLSWSMTSTQGIAGFIIERSYDGVYFEEIGDCACDASNRQRYTDSFVFPGYLYYRITAVMDDGSTETSETTMVRIVAKK